MFGLSFSSWKKSEPASGTGATATPSKKTGAMVLVGVLVVGGVGYKMFWPGSAPLKASADTKSVPASKGGSSSTPSKTKDKQTTGEKPAKPATRVPPNKTKPANPVAEDSDVPPTEEVETPAPKSAKPQAKPAPAAKVDPLGAPYVDEMNGFTIRFPASWPVRAFAGEPWVLDCGDGKNTLISIGFSPFPADFTADNIPPEWVARRIEKRKDTTLNSQGYAMIAGKKALWSKSTGPLPMSNGNPRMTRVNYIVPLGDGRVMEFRIATDPSIFEQMMPTMRASVESFKLLPRQHPPGK